MKNLYKTGWRNPTHFEKALAAFGGRVRDLQAAAKLILNAVWKKMPKSGRVMC